MAHIERCKMKNWQKYSVCVTKMHEKLVNKVHLNTVYFQYATNSYATFYATIFFRICCIFCQLFLYYYAYMQAAYKKGKITLKWKIGKNRTHKNEKLANIRTQLQKNILKNWQTKIICRLYKCKELSCFWNYFMMFILFMKLVF